jgi:adenosylhomocysteine nucleosidase
MPRKSVAVVVAMRRELEPLLVGVRGQRVNGVEFFELANAVIAVGGIGQSAARRAAEAVMKTYEPAILVSAGVAGALSPTLKVGDVVEGSEVVDAESGARFRTSGGESVIVSVSAVTGPEEKRLLAERYKAEVVDMESAAVAQVAREVGIECKAIKAISDELEFEMPPVAGFVDANGRFETTRFAAYVAIRPKWWSAVRRLSVNSRIASVNLSHSVEHLIDCCVNKKQEENAPRA